MTFTEPGEARDWLDETNPEMVEFLDRVNDLWEQAAATSVELGKDEDWWMSNDSEVYGITLDDKAAIKDWVVGGLQHLYDTMDLDENNQLNVQWMTQYIFSRLIQGWDYDERRVVVPQDIPKRSPMKLRDFDVAEVVEEIGPALADEEVDDYQEEVPSYG
jgi:hypothetical protein